MAHGLITFTSQKTLFANKALEEEVYNESRVCAGIAKIKTTMS